ncbi:hypothetical protein GH789_06675 [Rhizobium pusense]|nr:hypothetical protein [Agrobacterium pusense]
MGIFRRVARFTSEGGGCGLPPSALPGISPSSGEIDMRLGFDYLEV